MPSIDELQARIAKLEARLAEVEDEREIRELLATYGYTADSCRDEAYVDLWTEDGTMNLGSDTYKEVVRYQGKQGIREFIKDPKAHHHPDKYTNRMHVQGNNLQCRINGDEAVVSSYSIVLLNRGGQVTLDGAGNNVWTLRKVDGRWRIKERRRRAIGTEEYLKNIYG